MSRPSATILENLQSPRNAGVLADPHVVRRSDLDGRDPRITVFFEIVGETVARAIFQTLGCGYSIACCSALTELLIGRSIAECQEISAADIDEAIGGFAPEKQFHAEIAASALRDGVAQWDAKRGENDG